MNELIMCRICLNLSGRRIECTQLWEVYEKLTAIPFQTEMRPVALCSICRAQLTASRRLMLKCLKAEELLTQMLNHLVTNEDQAQVLIDRSALDHLSISSIEQVNVNSEQNIYIQNNDVEPILTEVKSEEQSLPDFQETCDIVSPDHAQRLSDSEDNQPLDNIEAVREQKPVREEIPEPDGLEEGDPISEKRDQKPELKESIEDFAIDSENNDAGTDDAGKHCLNCDSVCDAESDLVKHDDACRQNILENNNLSDSVEDDKLNPGLFTGNKLICDICNKSYCKKYHLIMGGFF